MKVLLTGATGFIGWHVARALAGHEVVTLGRDLLDPQFAFPASRFDVCIHLAWYVEPGKYLGSPLNQQWVEASLRLARAVNCRRFVAAGTCFEYDTSVGVLSESSPTRPDTLYGRCKLELFHALQKLDLNFAWVRIFYQYGPREDRRRLVPHVIHSLLAGQRAELTPGQQVRDFLHVADVGHAIAAVAASDLTGAVNIGSGEGVTVAELAGKIAGILGRPELLALGAKPYAPGEPMRIVADNAKLRATGWRPRYDLDAGLRDTVNWWKAQR
jgi:nucleoside-diphosphate-sugar epimerase